jgi:hypothetical protein
MYARRGFVVAGIALLLACQDSSGPSAALSLRQIAGTWDLSEYALMLVSDTTVQVDLKAAAELSVTLTIGASGAATAVVTLQDQAADTMDVTVALQGDTLAYSTSGGSFEFQVALAARRMTWLALYTDEFADVDGDGFADETRERLTWLRR